MHLQSLTGGVGHIPLPPGFLCLIFECAQVFEHLVNILKVEEEVKLSDLDQRTARIRAGIVLCSLCLASSHNRNMAVEVGAIDVSIATCTMLFCLAALVLAVPAHSRVETFFQLYIGLISIIAFFDCIETQRCYQQVWHRLLLMTMRG